MDTNQLTSQNTETFHTTASGQLPTTGIVPALELKRPTGSSRQSCGVNRDIIDRISEGEAEAILGIATKDLTWLCENRLLEAEHTNAGWLVLPARRRVQPLFVLPRTGYIDVSAVLFSRTPWGYWTTRFEQVPGRAFFAWLVERFSGHGLGFRRGLCQYSHVKVERRVLPGRQERYTVTSDFGKRIYAWPAA